MVERTCKDFSQELFSHFAKIFLFIFAEIDEGLHIERDEPERRNQNRKPKMKIKPYKFTTLENAKSFANRCDKMMGILMGDDSKFWVVCMSDFAKGIKSGYEAI